MKYNPRQGDIIWIEFSPAIDNELQGRHPAVVVSSNAYNEMVNYIIVCPITSHGNDFPGYIKLEGYDHVHGRINAMQIHSYSRKRIKSSSFVERLTGQDLLRVKQLLDYDLNIDF